MTGFSIIICCYNSTTRIEKTVEYLRNLKTKDFGFEVIIVDNNSSDDTYNTALSVARETREINISVIQEPETGKPNALIAGFNEAKYDYVVVCDDDNWLHEDYLTVAYEVMQKNNRIGALGGRGIIHTEANLPHWFSSLENAWAVGKQAEQSGDITETKGAVWGAGMVLRKSVWNEALNKGFSAFLTGRKSESVAMTGEDSELCIIVKKLGYKIYYEEKLQYLHDLPATRLNWKSLKNLWEGFSRSQVYFEMYDQFFNLNLDLSEASLKKVWKKSFRENLQYLFHGWRNLIWYKQMYIAFIEDRSGYLNGLEKRKYLYRLKELWRIRKKYSSYYKIIANFNG